MWKTTLVPHDFSESADHAARVARDEANLHGGRLFLLHVIELPFSMIPEAVVVEGGASVSVRDYALANAETRLKEIANELGVSAATTFTRFGVPENEIVRLVEEIAADVVVMGTHGRTGIRKLLAGSVTERIVRMCQIPVLVIHHPDPQ